MKRCLDNSCKRHLALTFPSLAASPQLRKINADKRPRIKGRFVKKTEEEMAMASSRAAVAAAAAATKEVSESMSVEDCLSDDDASL